MTIIRFGVTEIKRKGQLARAINDKMIIPDEWNYDNSHQLIIDRIRELYPGYNIRGYAWPKDDSK